MNLVRQQFQDHYTDMLARCQMQYQTRDHMFTPEESAIKTIAVCDIPS